MQNLSSSEPCPTLEQIQEQFETWRNQPRRSRKIPEELWDAAARLCLRHSLLKVSRALRLGYKELKERVQRIRQRPSAGSFVELGSLLPATEMVVDCEDASGCRQHIQYRGALQVDVPDLLKAFWEVGR